MIFARRRRTDSPDLDGAEEELVADLALIEEPVAKRGDAMNQDLVGRSGELGANFLENLDEEHEANEELEEDLDEELEEDLDEEHKADEDETSACAPYLARQMSCLGSRTPGLKDTPFLGSVWGAKEDDERLPPGGFVYARDLRASKHHRDTRSLPRFRPPGG